ncbi:MAG: aminotransferase class I/II-fold pyridoxal phosphate-dependent enzyme [Cyclobacteriaceae bacterium]
MNHKLSDLILSIEPSSTVGIADKVKHLREQGQTVYDFSAGRAFEPTPAYIVDVAHQAMRSGDTHQTMARGTTPFRQAVAEKLKRENGISANPDTEIITTMGVKQGMTLALLTLINEGDEVIVEDPCFVSYKQLIKVPGGVPVTVPLRKDNRFRWDPDELEAAITPRTRAIIFNSPHNPTGVVHTQEDLQVIADLAQKHGLYVISDEVYERIVWKGHKHQNLANLPGMRPWTITLTSLTKSFAMGGWRIGFAHADAGLIEKMVTIQAHLLTSCNAFVQTAAATAFANPAPPEVTAIWDTWYQKTQRITQALDAMEGLSCQMPEGAFYAWFDITALGISSLEFTERLLEQEKVALVHGSSFGEFGEGYIRMTCVKTDDELNHGLEGISRFLKTLTS